MDCKENIDFQVLYGVYNSENDITIVVPTYNRDWTLIKTIDSLNKLTPIKRLTYKILIVSNDPNYSIEGILDKLNKERYCVIRNSENLGMCGNMNRCAALAHTEYVAFVQDDDMLMPDYLVKIEELIISKKMENIDCLIPNRFFLYEDKNSINKSKIRHLYIKDHIQRIIRFGRKIPTLQFVTPKDAFDTQYNAFMGGPTCGILFKSESLEKDILFSNTYPYAFDFDFFMRYSNEHVTALYNEYLSVYRIGANASQKPEVELDFFKFNYDYISNRNISDRKKSYLIYLNYDCRSEKAKKLIDEQYSIKKVKKPILKIYKTIISLKIMNRGFYRRKLYI